MTKTATRAALLHICLVDLHAGKDDAADRLDALADAADDMRLRARIGDDAKATHTQRDRLAALGSVGKGPTNLWMAGILDDAERDARSHQRGPLRDIALIGALRKARAAEIVSSETALALAASAAPNLLPPLAANYREEIASEAALADLLHVIAGPVPSA